MKTFIFEDELRVKVRLMNFKNILLIGLTMFKGIVSAPVLNADLFQELKFKICDFVVTSPYGGENRFQSIGDFDKALKEYSAVMNTDNKSDEESEYSEIPCVVENLFFKDGEIGNHISFETDDVKDIFGRTHAYMRFCFHILSSENTVLPDLISISNYDFVKLCNYSVMEKYVRFASRFLELRKEIASKKTELRKGECSQDDVDQKIMEENILIEEYKSFKLEINNESI